MLSATACCAHRAPASCHPLEPGLPGASRQGSAPLNDCPSPPPPVGPPPWKREAAKWNQSRISHRQREPSDLLTYEYGATGKGVTIFLLDTGVLRQHCELRGRVAEGFSVTPGGAEDRDGHGTQLAGVVAGATLGVAPESTLYPVRITPAGSGADYSTGHLHQGVEHVLAQSQPGAGPAVVLLALHARCEGEDDADCKSIDGDVARLIASGLTVVASAGNDGEDSCDSSPLRGNQREGVREGLITVGATDEEDTVHFNSNRGGCVDLYAPGEDITTATNTGERATRGDVDGTSIAAAHVAGAAALYLQRHPEAKPREVKSWLLDNARTLEAEGQPFRFLYTAPEDLAQGGR